MRLTKHQKELLLDLGFVGEALKQGTCFEGGGCVLSHVETMERLAKYGLVTIEKIGQSVFATLSAKGQETSNQFRSG